MCFQTDEINVLPESFSQDQVQKDSERTFKKFLDLQVKNIDNLIFFR